MAELVAHMRLGMRLIFLLLSLVAFPDLAAEEMRVLLVLGGNNAPYLAFADTFLQNLPSGIRTEVIDKIENYSDKTSTADLVIAVGSPAAKRVNLSATTTPVLLAMVPRNAYEDEVKSRRAQNKPFSALYIDQPWNRQVELLRIAVPERRRVGVLYSESSRLDLRTLQGLLNTQGYSLFAKILRSPDTLFTDMEEVLDHCDILLAIPDNLIYGPNTIRNILLSSYRHGIPLVGFSQPYVKAGALYSLFATPEQLASQAATITSGFAKSRALPDPQYSRQYSIDINQDVARAMNIRIRAAESLKMQLEEMQVKP